MKIAVLFDGAGLARLGLEQAGHDCTGFEVDIAKHLLSLHVGSGNTYHADVRELDLSGFDAVWASPPCQLRSVANTQHIASSKYADGSLLAWSLALPHDVLWVENVPVSARDDAWGQKYNAAQFLQQPIQNRVRIVGGRYKLPEVYWEYKRFFKGLTPCILAHEHGGKAMNFTASQALGRDLTMQECAYYQGLTIPDAWFHVPDGYTVKQWRKNIYEAIGNGFPVYAAKKFGERYV